MWVGRLGHAADLLVMPITWSASVVPSCMCVRACAYVTGGEAAAGLMVFLVSLRVSDARWA